ncbi:MAG: hypothetical protein SF187_23490 [Deltaproteobacteria bacterium]|nr:hypothetical protein [Deltaproteobacteria bacterium]
MSPANQPPAVIIGAGSLSAVGGTLAVQVAAVRAGLSRIFLHPDTGEPTPSSTRVSRATYFPDDGSDDSRLRAFLWAAVTEAVERSATLRSESQVCKAWLRIPANRPPFDETLGTDLTGILLEAAPGVAATNVRLVDDAVSNALGMLVEAQAFLSANPQHGVAIVAACDTLVSDDAMDHLVEARRLATEARPWGLVPGEGAACLVLIHPQNPLAKQCPPLAAVMGAGIAGGGDKPSSVAGADLTRAIGLATKEGTPMIAAVLSDLNGERLRSDDWAFSAPRMTAKLQSDVEVVTPATNQGDLGVATPLALMALAAAHLAAGWHTGDGLVATTGDGKQRGAAWLSPISQAQKNWFRRSRVKSVLARHDEAIVKDMISELGVLIERKRAAVVGQAQEGLPDWTSVASLERRIDRFVQALVVCRELGQAGAEAALKAGTSLGTYWGARVALQRTEGSSEPVPSNTALSTSKHLESLMEACRHTFTGAKYVELVERFAAHPNWTQVAAALAGYSGDPTFRGLVVKAAQNPKALDWKVPFAMSRVCNQGDVQWLKPWLATDDASVLNAAVFAWQYLDPSAANPFVFENARSVPLLLANTADARAVSILLADAEANKLRPSFYLALGILGDPAALPHLLLGLEHESTVREASSALALLTGVELWETIEKVRRAPDVELFADELERRKAGDETVGVTRTEEVRLCQTAAVWAERLAENAPLQPGVRYRLGRPLDARVAVEALTLPWVLPRLRVALANELGCVFGVRPFVEPDATVAQQREQLEAANEHARAIVMKAPGSWGIYLRTEN